MSESSASGCAKPFWVKVKPPKSQICGNMPAAHAGHYAILELPTSASAADIQAAFRRLALVHHPDKGGDAAQFLRIREAQEVLGEEHKRYKYDASRKINENAARITEQTAEINTIFGRMNDSMDDMNAVYSRMNDEVNQMNEQMRDMNAELRQLGNMMKERRG
ncbi:hypothetical protein LTR85_006556 [Meristemomyces frigidus]|nr:hypothetical protein LTR85_006556 [Meristemomyces frigidus]